jgi:phosphate transport system ATP-binding protein
MSGAEAVATPKPVIVARGLSAWFGGRQVLFDVTLGFDDRAVTAIIGPSGCGKSTLLRCLNRLHETVPGAHATGSIVLDGSEVMTREVDPVRLRRVVGFVGQQPAPFPALSIRGNIAAGARAAGQRPPDEDAIIERALVRAALWDEVKDRLDAAPDRLSVGQQQRLCIARALAAGPRVLCLDEPTAALDPLNVQRIEELLYDLSRDVAIIVVTHNMQQAARIAARTAFLLDGRVVEEAPSTRLFTAPTDPRTEAWLTGRFG